MLMEIRVGDHLDFVNGTSSMGDRCVIAFVAVNHEPANFADFSLSETFFHILLATLIRISFSRALTEGLH